MHTNGELVPEQNEFFNSDPSDRALHVEFYWEAKETTAAGGGEWVQYPHIKIISPGGKSEHIELLKPGSTRHEHFKKRFPRQWQAFERGNAKPTDGMPLEQWPLLNIAQVRSLQSKGFYSVDQIAHAPDSALQYLGLEGRKLRDKAKAFLEAAKGAAPINQLVEQNHALNAQIEQLKADFAAMHGDQLKALKERLDELEAENKALKEKKKPGRPVSKTIEAS